MSAVAATSPSAEAPSAPSLMHSSSFDQGAEEVPAAEGQPPVPVTTALEAKLATVAGPSHQPDVAAVDSIANGELTRLDVRGDCDDARSSHLVTVWRHLALLSQMPVAACCVLPLRLYGRSEELGTGGQGALHCLQAF